MTRDEADDRRYPERPLVGVGAIILDGSRVLMVVRGRPPRAGWWSLPGGLLETGETLAEAVRREASEETGLDVEPAGVLEIFERIIRDAEGRVEYHYVLVDYVCRAAAGEPRASSDVRAAEWIERTELPNLQITEGTLPVIEKAFRERGRFES